MKPPAVGDSKANLVRPPLLRLLCSLLRLVGCKDTRTSMTSEVGVNRRCDTVSQIFVPKEVYLRTSPKSAVQFKTAMHGLELADVESENLYRTVPAVIGGRTVETDLRESESRVRVARFCLKGSRPKPRT
jgi:hypothetical protein